jgi:hypothetical protein
MDNCRGRPWPKWAIGLSLTPIPLAMMIHVMAKAVVGYELAPVIQPIRPLRVSHVGHAFQRAGSPPCRRLLKYDIDFPRQNSFDRSRSSIAVRVNGIL